MAVKKCDYCQRVYVEWLWTSKGKKMPFEYQPIPATEDTGRAGWIPAQRRVNGRNKVVMTPIVECGNGKLPNVRRVFRLHQCPEYTAQRGARLENAR